MNSDLELFNDSMHVCNHGAVLFRGRFIVATLQLDYFLLFHQYPPLVPPQKNDGQIQVFYSIVQISKFQSQ